MFAFAVFIVFHTGGRVVEIITARILVEKLAFIYSLTLRMTLNDRRVSLAAIIVVIVSVFRLRSATAVFAAARIGPAGPADNCTNKRTRLAIAIASIIADNGTSRRAGKCTKCAFFKGIVHPIGRPSSPKLCV